MKEPIERILAIKDLEATGYDGFVVATTQQEVTVGIDNGQSCCEDWGHFWTNDKPEEFIGAELLGISVVDEALNTRKLEEHCEYGVEGDGIMFVNFETSKGILQFTAYNSHNGYYGHEAFVKSQQLDHVETL
jgi:hypothetical protein